MIFFYKQQRDIFIIPPKDDFVRLTTFMLGIVLGMIFWEIKKGLRISPKPLYLFGSPIHTLNEPRQ